MFVHPLAGYLQMIKRELDAFDNAALDGLCDRLASLMLKLSKKGVRRAYFHVPNGNKLRMVPVDKIEEKLKSMTEIGFSEVTLFEDVLVEYQEDTVYIKLCDPVEVYSKRPNWEFQRCILVVV